MSEVQDYSLTATKRYLQSVVFVDDKLYHRVSYAGDVKVETPTSMKIFASRTDRKPIAKAARRPQSSEESPADPPIKEPTETTKGGPEVPLKLYDEVAAAMSEGREPAEVFNAKDLVASFARNRIVCALYEPEKDFATDPDSDIFKLCERADAVIFDWDLYKDAGQSVLTLISGLVAEGQTTVPHHVRLCAIYTSMPDLAKVANTIFEQLMSDGATVEPLDKDPLILIAGSTRIVVLGKPAPGRLPDQKRAEVKESDLADRVIDEFASMHEGILPSLVLNSLAAIRSNSKKILDKFRRDLDGAFLVHRGAVYPDDEAFEQIPELLAEEALAVMIDTASLKTELANKLVAELADAFKLTLDWAAKPGRVTPAAGVFATRFLKEGRGGVKEDVKVDKKRIEQLHEALDQTKTAHLRLASLYNTRTQYGTRRDLCFGTIIRTVTEQEAEYSVCLMPLCDSIRLDSTAGKTFRFPFWRLQTGAVKGSKGIVVELPETGDYLELHSYGKPRDRMWIGEFEASDTRTVAASREDGRYLYRRKDQEVTLEWIAQLKPGHAQRIAHDIGSAFSRVGVLEAEWLRWQSE
ncbi:MAG: response regulator receiver domain [Rhizobiaceae bacterium]|nr:response regulator receiver domain [Rhizobiaceae bacterium]